MRRSKGIHEDLKDKIERIKSEKSKKEGEAKAILDRLKKEFGVKTLDDVYKESDDISLKIEKKEEERDELLIEAEERLAKFR